MLCPTHHRLVEPPRDRPPDWDVKIHADGLPRFTPPKWIDPDQRPILHHRHKNRAKPPGPPAEPNRAREPNAGAKAKPAKAKPRPNAGLPPQADSAGALGDDVEADGLPPF
jgi:hypothetical protein